MKKNQLIVVGICVLLVVASLGFYFSSVVPEPILAGLGIAIFCSAVVSPYVLFICAKEVSGSKNMVDLFWLLLAGIFVAIAGYFVWYMWSQLMSV